MQKRFLGFRKKIERKPKLKQKIFDIDSKIRFITIIDSRGRLIENQHRKDVTSILTEKESKRSVNQIIKFWKDNKYFYKKYGNAKYVIIEYEKIKRIVIYLSDKEVLYVTTDPESNHKKIISKIIGFIENV